MRRFLLIPLILTGCTFGGAMDRVASPSTVSVTWEQRWPDKCGDIPFFATILGCTYPSKDWSKCRIVAPEDVSDEVLGHELRHCFGWVHKK